MFTVPLPTPFTSIGLLLLVLVALSWGQLLHSRRRPVVDSVGQELAAMSEQVARLSRLACLDAVTGLPNGHVLELEALPRAVQDCSEMLRPLTVAYIDLDGFKAVNDRLGHDAGDEMLRGAAAAMESALRRGTDRAYRRYAGDEFVVLLPGADEERAGLILAQVLAALNRASVRASIGGVVMPQARGVAPRRLLLHADEVMRTVKRGGGNAVKVVVEA